MWADVPGNLVVQEDEPRLREDLESFLRDLVPDEGHAHDRLDDNADSHLRATVLGPDVTVSVANWRSEAGSRCFAVTPQSALNEAQRCCSSNAMALERGRSR